MCGFFYFTDTEKAPSKRVIENLPSSIGLIVRLRDKEENLSTVSFLRRRFSHKGFYLLSTFFDGVSLGGVGYHQKSLSPVPPVMFSKRKAGILYTCSVHSVKNLLRCHREIVLPDVIFLSPVFETRSHDGVRGLGLYVFLNMVKRSVMPVYGLGGITSVRRVRRVLKFGIVKGVGGISIFQNDMSTIKRKKLGETIAIGNFDGIHLGHQ